MSSKARARYHTGKWRAKQVNALPKWLSREDKDSMRRLYQSAVDSQEMLGIKVHVDHIIPLNGETVCGLHVPWNLQLMCGSENCQKRNKF